MNGKEFIKALKNIIEEKNINKIYKGKWRYEKKNFIYSNFIFNY